MSRSGRNGWAASYLAIAFAVGWFIHAGQYSFLLGVAGFLLFGGHLLQANEPFGGPFPRWLLLLPVIYLSHLVPFRLALLLLGWRLLLEFGRPGRRAVTLRFAKRAALVVAPLLVLAIVFGLTRSGAERSARMRVLALAKNALTLDNVIRAFEPGERVAGILVALTIASVNISGLWKAYGHWSLHTKTVAAFVSTVVALYVLLPDECGGGGYLSARLLFVTYLAALICCVTTDLPRFVLRAMAAAGIISSLMLVGMRQGAYVPDSTPT